MMQWTHIHEITAFNDQFDIVTTIDVVKTRRYREQLDHGYHSQYNGTL